MNWIDLAMADTSTQGRIRAMEAFISAWYGPWKPEHGIDGVDARTDLPDALRWFYGRHGRRKELITYNNLAGPDDKWQPYIEGGAPPAGDRRVFLSENQGVYVWGHDPGEADPRVWCALNETGGAWAAEEETLAGFMFQLLLCELHGPNHTIAYWIDREQYELIASRFQSLPLAPRSFVIRWDDPDLDYGEFRGAFLAGDTVVVAAAPEIERRIFVDIKSQTQSAIDELHGLLPGDHWDNPCWLSDMMKGRGNL